MSVGLQSDVVDALAFCRDAGCVGYEQQPVKALREVRSWSFQESGGDGQIPGEYRSAEFLSFADPSDVACQFCGLDRQVTLQPRPDYGVTARPVEKPVVDSSIAKVLVNQAAQLARLEAERAPKGED